MPMLALIALFILVPLAELYVILKVGDAIGVLWTIALLAADSVLGSLLLRSQGRTVWRRFNMALAEGRMPHREVLDGVLIVFGGAFLLTPGFLTDIVGIVLLVPPTRSIIRRIVARRLGRRVTVGVVGGAPPGGRRAPSGDRQAYDVEGTATEHEARTEGLEARSGRERREQDP
jgi:UPF0716 protein FxsA